MMGVCRRRAASARGADLISSLGDDILVRILEQLPDAADAVRTGELSRRWRGLWTRVRSLTFASPSSPRFKRASGARRFLAFVGSALAQRAMASDNAALEYLAISFMGLQTEQSSQAADEWILYALQNAVRSFVLELSLPMSDLLKLPTINLSQFPSSSNLESLHLKLDGVGVQLPATAVFTSLVDLSLEDFEFAARNLTRFLSSPCCPHLQKLHLRKLRLLERYTNLLKVEASALLELYCEKMEGAWGLELKTPSLRVLHLVDRYHHGYLETVRISAPRLEEITFLYDMSMHMFIDGDELPCVKSLKTELQSYGSASSNEEELKYYTDYDINFSCICLLRCCTSVTSLEVSLGLLPKTGRRLGDLTSGRIPHLKHVVSLTVDVSLPELHSFGLGLADLLAQCSNLKYFRVYSKLWLPKSREHDYLCNHGDHWKFHQIRLHDIEEVEFTGLAGTECERWFVRQVIAHATHLQKVTLSLSPTCKLAEEDNDKYFRSSEIIPGGGGTWICHDPGLSYEWNPDP